MSSNATLKQIQCALKIITNVSHCSGSVPLDPATALLFYLNDGKAGFVDFAKPTEAQLVALSEACLPEISASSENESSCKAGKMDTSQFSTQFSPLTNAIIGTVNSNILRGRLDGTGKSIHVELDKLNVYGPGSFVKVHTDTPRRKNMFGSLVVILPAVHEGGSLILRCGGMEKVFDTAHAVNSQDTPHAAFVAFLIGVSHELAPVKSGYRVTLTYNLFITGSTGEAPTSGPNLNNAGDQQVIKLLQGLMKNLLHDPTFLPEGGFLGFGLSHKYPFNSSSSTSDLGQIINNLKGGDDEVKRICEALGLRISLKAIYTDETPPDESPCCLVDHCVDFYPDEQVEGGLVRYVYENRKKALVVYPDGMDLEDEDFLEEKGKPIVWLREFTAETNSFNSSYLRYGNEATLSIAYGDVCLVVEVAKAADRIH